MSADKSRLKKLKNEYKEYYKNYSLLVTLGLIWIGAAYAGTFEVQISILVLFFGVTIFKPILFLTTKILGAKKIHKDESLKLLNKLIVIGIVFGLIIGFFPFEKNINLFFPTFTIIFGLIFFAISISSGLKMYGIISAMLLGGACFIGYQYTDNFTLCGYYTGYTLFGFGILNGIFGKKARITLRFLKRKLKVQTFRHSPTLPENTSNIVIRKKKLLS